MKDQIEESFQAHIKRIHDNAKKEGDYAAVKACLAISVVHGWTLVGTSQYTDHS